MATPARARALVLEYRRRQLMDTFTNGETYTETNFDFEDTQVGGSYYGRCGQSNQEILDMLVMAANKVLDALANKVLERTPVPAGHLPTYNLMEAYVPEYLKKKKGSIKLYQGTYNQEGSFAFTTEDYGYLCAAELQLDLQSSTAPTFVFYSCLPVSSLMLMELRRAQIDEYDEIPLYWLETDAQNNKLYVHVFVQGDIVPSSIGFADFDLNLYYIAHQLPIATDQDLLMNQKFDSMLLDIMVDAYERLKK